MNIEPCTGCLQKYGYDINSFNNCCINTCASFIGGGLNEIMNSDCGKKCIAGMGEIIKNTGKNPCQFWPSVAADLSTPPPFLESLAKAKGDIPKAVLLCRKECDSRINPLECKEACDLAATALIFESSKPIEKYTPSNQNKIVSDVKTKISDAKNSKGYTIFFYIGLVVVVLAVIGVFLKILF